MNKSLRHLDQFSSSYIDRSENYETANEAVLVENISVLFRSYKNKPTSLKETIIKFVKDRTNTNFSDFEALSNISFTVPKGKVIGFIGSNGAGKSTLLRVLTGVLPPTKGLVRINGTVDSLIQLGAGFDSELNAVENIYLNGSLHGKSKKYIKSRIDKILDFAELQEFANTPIKYFSSGMYARLGFSVAIDNDPDILIVDEVLAVGDERFQDKCYDYFDKFIKRNKSIIIVSHSLELLGDFADQIGLLSNGKLVFIGEPEKAIELYRSNNYEKRLV